MDVELVGGLIFLACGGLLILLAFLMAARVNRFRQSAVRTTGKVVEAWSEAVVRRPLESFYQEEGPRQHIPNRAPRVYAYRTRRLRVEYCDEAGKRYEAIRIVSGRYKLGQRVNLLFPRNDPANIQIDSKLEAYGTACVIGALAMVFMMMGGAALIFDLPKGSP